MGLDTKDELERQNDEVAKDPILDLLIQVLEDQESRERGASIPATVLMNGFLVSGDLITFEQYARCQAQEGRIPILFKELEKLRKEEREKRTEKSEGVKKYFHMENARFFDSSSQPIPSGNGVIWRGCLSDVSGFFLGSLNVGQTEA